MYLVTVVNWIFLHLQPPWFTKSYVSPTVVEEAECIDDENNNGNEYPQSSYDDMLYESRITRYIDHFD